MTNESIEQRAMRTACRAVLRYGEGDEREQKAAKELNLWKDHPAYVAAMAMAKELGYA